MKKYSWIVALLIALSFTAIFIGCGADPLEAPPPDADEFIEVELGDFNTWGGANDKQQGWATDDLVFLGVGDKLTTAKKMGYSVDDFQAAQFLELELAADQPSDGLRLIWGVDEGSGGGWNTGMVMTDGRALDPCAKLDGTTLTIDLARCLPDYPKYLNATEATGLRLVLQYWNQGIEALGIKSAKLLIPAETPPFVSITKIDAVTKSLSLIAGATDPDGNPFPAVQSLTLVPVITTDSSDPQDLPTAKTVIWSIVSDTTKTTAPGAGFVEIPDGTKTVKNKEVWPWADVTEVVPVGGNYADRIKATAVGNIVVRAIVEDGIIVKESDVGKDLQTVATSATHDSVFKGSDDATGKVGWVTADDVGKTYNFISKEITIVASAGFAKVATITTADPSTSGDTTIWSWFDTAGAGSGVKGKLAKAYVDKLLAQCDKNNAEIWIYWTSIANRNGWGCGAFGSGDDGATQQNWPDNTATNAGGTAGINRILLTKAYIEPAITDTGEMLVNIWNSITVTKIEVWANQ